MKVDEFLDAGEAKKVVQEAMVIYARFALSVC